MTFGHHFEGAGGVVMGKLSTYDESKTGRTVVPGEEEIVRKQKPPESA
jgi:hypothetical protein